MPGAQMAGDEDVSHAVPRGEITQHLLAWNEGDPRALCSVFAALYETLHALAGRALAGERADHTLGTAGLVSEAFFRLMEQQRIQWRSREHFIAIAAQMMRRILIDYARARSTTKRGHAMPVLPIDAAALVASDSLEELVAIHDALDALAAVDRTQSEIVELRFFGGMTHDEIAAHLGLSLPTVERRWRLARAWLYRRLGGVAA
jgi:RNA polymerase sigma factor (TIGR02999 family)